MNLNSSAMELSGALKDLRALWADTKMYWNDPVSQAFEEQQWNLVEARVLGALRAIERLAPVIDRVRHDCGR
jgi:hypothetical protein